MPGFGPKNSNAFLCKLRWPFIFFSVVVASAATKTTSRVAASPLWALSYRQGGSAQGRRGIPDAGKLLPGIQQGLLPHAHVHQPGRGTRMARKELRRLDGAPASYDLDAQ